MKMISESEVTQSCSLLATPWTAAYQAPPSMGFSRQEYWSGVALPSPEYAIEVRKSGIQSLKYIKINNNNKKQYRINCKFFSIRKIIKVTTHQQINRNEPSDHLINAEKVCDKIEQSLMIKNIGKLRIEEDFFNSIDTI